jgi:hypothetical protein
MGTAVALVLSSGDRIDSVCVTENTPGKTSEKTQNQSWWPALRKAKSDSSLKDRYGRAWQRAGSRNGSCGQCSSARLRYEPGRAEATGPNLVIDEMTVGRRSFWQVG